MRKILSVALGLLMLSTPAFPQSAPPSVKGQRDAGYMRPKPNLQVPNKQATNLGGLDVLLETGNSDILQNGSFENPTNPKDGWLTSPSTVGLELSDVTDGKQAIYLQPSTQPVEVSQDSTINVTAFSGGTIQGVAKARVKVSTDATGPIDVCPRSAGAIVSNLCVQVTANNTWQTISIPFVLGGTSNGISVHSRNYDNVTATKITIDSMKVETNADLIADTGVVGPWTDGTCTSSWVSNSVTSCKYRQNGQNLEVQYMVTTSGAPTATALQVQLPTGFTADTSKLAVGSSYISEVGDCLANDSGSFYYNCQAMLVSNVTISIRSVNSAGTYANTTSSLNNTTPITFGAGDYVTFTVNVPVSQLAASSSTFLSQNGNTSWAPCGHTTSDFQGFGTVTNIETQCKREGDDLLMRGKFTAGTATAVEARLALRFNGQTLTSAGSPKIPSIQVASGGGLSAVSASQRMVLIEPSVNYVTFGQQSSATVGLAKNTGSDFLSNTTFSFTTVRIPIAGWENSNIIIGSFKEVPVIPGTTKMKKCIVSFGGAGSLTSPTVCSSTPCTEYSDNCGTASTSWASAGYTTTTWSAGTWKPNTPVNCGVTSKGASTFLADYNFVNPSTDGSGGMAYPTASANTSGTSTNSYKTLWCEAEAP